MYKRNNDRARFLMIYQMTCQWKKRALNLRIIKKKSRFIPLVMIVHVFEGRFCEKTQDFEILPPKLKKV